MAEGHDRESPVEDAIVEKWKREQIELKKKLVCKDCIIWGESTSNPFSNLSLIGGVDISFVKDDPDHACACLVVLSFPKLEIILVDGNGMLHPRGFGIACHLGVLTDIPTVGVAKTLFHVDGIKKDSKHADQIKNCLKSSGDSFPLMGDSGTIWGKALRSTQGAHNPIYISVGHKIGLETAVSLVHTTCRVRIPEPIRQADKRSREYLQKCYPNELENCSCRIQNDERNPLKEHNDPEKEGQDLVHDSC